MRLPAKLVRELGLDEGDRIELVASDGPWQLRRQPRAAEILDDLRRFRGRLPAIERLGRDSAHER